MLREDRSFGYDTGQISGFLEMPDFLARFGQNIDGTRDFDNVRKGLIVGLVCFIGISLVQKTYTWSALHWNPNRCTDRRSHSGSTGTTDISIDMVCGCVDWLCDPDRSSDSMVPSDDRATDCRSRSWGTQSAGAHVPRSFMISRPRHRTTKS